MTAPLTPEPSGHGSSAHRAPAPTPGSTSSHNSKPPGPPPPPPEDVTSVIRNHVHEIMTGRPAPSAEEDSPTVISSARPKPSPDPLHAAGLVGRRLGHFELLESVGVGGMAAVIKAQDLDLGREVALKILPPDMAADPENITRFKQEARAAARLDHENVARVYFCGEDQGLHFIAFEFVEGENLRLRMERLGGTLPVAEAVPVMIQVAAGLSHACSRGVVHRDIKPSNIIITPDGKAKIVDMGLARNLDPRAANGQLTQSGVTLGTFDYISPEQAIEPRSADCRSDIYSLGCTFYHALTGHPPVPDGTPAKKLDAHQRLAPLDPREYDPDIPDELAAVLAKMMAKDPAQRYQHPDHLLHHLLVLAKKLGIPVGAISPDSAHRAAAYVDQALPAPPAISPMWVGVAVAVLAVGLFALTGGFGSPAPLNPGPFWEKGRAGKDAASGPSPVKDAAPRPDGKGPEAPVVAKGPREARNAADLLALLRQPDAHIKLRPNTVYDLTRPPRKDAEPPAALFEGTSLVIECDRLLDPPTIRLRAAAADDGKTPRPGALTVRGPSDGSTAKVRLRGVRFEFVADEPEPGQTPISLANIDQLDVTECTFVPPLKKGLPQDGPAAVTLVQTLARDAAPRAAFDRCYFAPGSVAVLLVKHGPQELRATECAFGPQHAVVRVQGSADDESRAPALVRLESCTALMSSGAVVEIGDGVPCKVQAGWCLFSNPGLPEGEAPRAFVVRQLGMPSSETRFEGLRTGDDVPAAMPNGYQHVLAYASGDVSYSFEDCKAEQLPIEDPAARILTKHPWKEEAPVKRLHDFPEQFKQAFAVDLRQDVLRLAPDKNRNLLGTKHLAGVRVYDLFPFGPPESEARLAANVRVWQPDFPEGKTPPPNVYRSLVKAIDDLKRGDVLLVRYNGRLEVDPAEFKKADTDVTVRPDKGYRPELVPRAPTLKKDPALFKLYGGSLLLENLQFVLKPDRAPAVVSIPGGGQCTFRNCWVTLEEGDDLTAVALADPKGEMMPLMGSNGGGPEKWPAPKVAFENTFVRGRGKVLQVSTSRPFELRARGSLFVLDGSVVCVEPSAGDVSEAAPAQVSLERVTTYLTKHVVSQRATEKRTESKGPGLVQLLAHAEQCLFVPALESASLVHLERIDSMEQMEAVFQWKDARQNVYGFKSDQPLLSIVPENADAAMRLERVERDRWLARWRESDYAFGEVSFAAQQASKRLDGAKPGDFEVKSVMPSVKSDAGEFGAPVEVLRRGAEE